MNTRRGDFDKYWEMTKYLKFAKNQRMTKYLKFVKNQYRSVLSVETARYDRRGWRVAHGMKVQVRIVA